MKRSNFVSFTPKENKMHVGMPNNYFWSPNNRHESHNGKHISKRIRSDVDFYIHRPLVCHLPPTQLQKHRGPCQNQHPADLAGVHPRGPPRSHSAGHKEAPHSSGHHLPHRLHLHLEREQHQDLPTVPRALSLRGSFLLMAVAYYQIAKVLWNKNIPGSSEMNHHPSRTTVSKQNGKNGATVRLIAANPSCEGQIQSRRKAAKMLIAVVVIFGLCYLPVHLINALRYTVGLPQNSATTVVSLISHWLCYANSSINPIIYNFMNGKFRKNSETFSAVSAAEKRIQDDEEKI
ncbi:orexin receptor type 1 [Caerostris extrusa]|uniref:Orexin receptor type 1 n=1 Tax=Caerostris extrusa TaxID=172846 RepID=A0AAV4QNH0_CAEEX|nr:orexin receptor type 1 [Caerostris extrusa]